MIFFTTFFGRLKLGCVFLFIFGLFGFSNAQTIPIGSCGILFTYDASGNQISRQYVCNNTFATMQSMPEEILLEESSAENQHVQRHEVLKAEVVYPNPTSGILNIRLYKPLEHGQVSILDLSGRIVWKEERQGKQLVLDVSALDKGNYILRIEDNASKTSITQNIIKL